MKKLIALLILLSAFSCTPQSPAEGWTGNDTEKSIYKAGIEYIDKKVYPGDVREYTQHSISYNAEDSIYMSKIKGIYLDGELYQFNLQVRTELEKGIWVHEITNWFDSSEAE